MRKTGLNTFGLALIAALMSGFGQEAVAQDKVKVGVFPTASSLPYFVAIERGFFKEQNIEPETIRLIGGPPNIAAMISNQIEAAVVLVTIEAMNANLKKPGVAMYVGVHSQNKTYQMEQFVVRKGMRRTPSRISGERGSCRRRDLPMSLLPKRCSRRRGSRNATTPSISSTWASMSM
jgi:NitT/TauT family transport system substrate-binding protein